MTEEQYRTQWLAAMESLHAAEDRYEEATGAYVTPAALELTAALARVRAVKLEWLTDRYHAAVRACDTAEVVHAADPTARTAYALTTAQGAVREARAALDVLQRLGDVAAHTVESLR